MREIKFRAWEVKEKRMIDNGSFDIHLFGTGGHGVSHKFLNEEQRQYKFSKCKRNNFDENKPEVILMQFTGLKDKNGKDIYEGDIVRPTKFSVNKRFIVCQGIVNIEDNECYGDNLISGFYLELVDDKTDIRHIDNLEDRIIVGNIYKNPELLEKVK